MAFDLEGVWKQYGLDQLQEGLRTLFPDYSISLRELLDKVLAGDVAGLLRGCLQAAFGEGFSWFLGMRNVLIWLLVLGIVSAVMTRFIEIFDKHQIADMGFYFMYLLLTAVLLQCFGQAAELTKTAIGSACDFIRLLIPAYLMIVGLSGGAASAGIAYQLILLAIYGVEHVLLSVLVPFVYSYCLLAVVNELWTGGKLGLLMDLLGKGIKAVLKAAVGIVTGLGVIQAVIAPVLDTVRTSVLRKTISVIPGLGDAADGVVELVLGSALVIKNSVGVVLLALLLTLCAAPLLQIFGTACLLKMAAALMGIVSDHRISSVTDRVGEGGFLLFRTAGTALLLFLIAIAMTAAAAGRGG